MHQHPLESYLLLFREEIDGFVARLRRARATNASGTPIGRRQVRDYIYGDRRPDYETASALSSATDGVITVDALLRYRRPDGFERSLGRKPWPPPEPWRVAALSNLLKIAPAEHHARLRAALDAPPPAERVRVVGASEEAIERAARAGVRAVGKPWTYEVAEAAVAAVRKIVGGAREVDGFSRKFCAAVRRALKKKRPAAAAARPVRRASSASRARRRVAA